MKSLTNLLLSAILSLSVASCLSTSPESTEANFAFRIDRNQLVLDHLRLGGYDGRFVVGTASPETIVSSHFASRHGLTAGSTPIVMMRDDLADRTEIAIADLSEEMDAIIGSDLLGPVVVIDFRTQLLTRFPRRPPDSGKSHRWQTVPSVQVTVDGKQLPGVIDTAVPDSLIVPASILDRECRRCTVDVEIAGVRFQDIDVRAADVERVRIGNRILQHFQVTIDYRGRTASLLRR